MKKHTLSFDSSIVSAEVKNMTIGYPFHGRSKFEVDLTFSDGSNCTKVFNDANKANAFFELWRNKIEETKKASIERKYVSSKSNEE